MADLIPRTAAIEAAFKGADDGDGGVQPEWFCEHGERRDSDAAD